MKLISNLNQVLKIQFRLQIKIIQVNINLVQEKKNQHKSIQLNTRKIQFNKSNPITRLPAYYKDKNVIRREEIEDCHDLRITSYR